MLLFEAPVSITMLQKAVQRLESAVELSTSSLASAAYVEHAPVVTATEYTVETCKTETKHQCDKVNTKLIYQIFQGKWKRERRRFRNSSVPFLNKSCVTNLCHVSFQV